MEEKHKKATRNRGSNDLVNWQRKSVSHLKQVETPCIIDGHHSKKDALEVAGEVASVCAQIVLKCQDSASIGPPDILRTVDTVARVVTKWNGACDQRWARLICHIHFTKDCRHFCHLGDQADNCKLSCFATDLHDSKSTSGGVSCMFLVIKQSCQLRGCAEKQTAISFSITKKN